MDTEESQTSGWSGVMIKILQSKVKTDKFILSKAKKDRDIVIEKSKSDEPEEDDVEVIDDEGNSRGIQSREHIDELEEIEVKQPKAKKFKRIKPERRSTWTREPELNALATKGVVQLFNAVNQHRKLICKNLESSGKSERKRDKTLSKFSTDTFMEILSTSKDGGAKVTKKKQFQDVLSEEVEGTRIDEWESDDQSDS